MKLFQNYKTKKQLREEIAFLKGLRQSPIMHVERNIMKVRSCLTIDECEAAMPIEYAKRQISRNLVDEMQRFIRYDIEDGECRGRRVIVGTLDVAINQ